MMKKLFLLFALLCFAVSGTWAYEVHESFDTNKQKRTYESDYVKITCDDFSNSGIILGGLLFDRFLTITAKHATLNKVVLTATNADYVGYIRKINDNGELSISGNKVTIAYSDHPTVVQYTSFDYYVYISHVDVYYEPTELAPNAAGEYSISNENEWELFCSTVNSGKTTFSGKKVNLTNDIDITEPVTTMVGAKEGMEQYFSGTFDGQGHTLTINLNSSENRCSPFRIVKDATIQDLRVEGTITCKSFSGGIIGATEGVVTLKNCCSAVNLTKLSDGGEDIGGLIGCVNSGSSLNVEGCSFTGSMNLSQTYCSGMVGNIYDNNEQNLSISFLNCLVAPSSANCSSQSCSTFCNTNKPGNCSFINCYYFTAIGTAQGKKARKISAKTYDNVGSVTLENAGTPATEYTYSGITAYSTGIKYNNEFYAGNGDVVSLSLTTPTAGYAVSAVEADRGTLSGSDNPYSLTLNDDTDYYVTITALLAKGYKVYVNDVVSGNTTLVGFTTNKESAIYEVGDQVTLTATLGTNVTLNSVTVIPDSDPSLSQNIPANPENKYSFYMPASNVTVTYDYYLDNGSTYDITWNGGEGTKMVAQVGGISVLKADKGDIVTITLSDELKKRATNVTVTGKTSNNSVDVTRASIQDNAFTFTMPAENVTVAADFKSAIYMMTAGHCTINASVEDGESTEVNDLVGVLAADQGELVTLNVISTVAGEAISQVALTYTPIGGENVMTYATKVDASSFTFTMPDAVTVTVLPESVFALADGADNSSILSVHNGKTIDLMLQNRTLYRDGKWNTLCLPFEVTISDTHPFAGATVKLLDNSGEYASENGTYHTGCDAESSTLYLYFKNPETTESDVVIPAGMPFIIKWEGQYEDNIVDPIIYNVAIDNVEPAEIHFKGGKFVGSYSPISITDEDRSILYLGAENTLYYPSGAMTIGSCRAYFQLNGITAGTAPSRFVLNFDGEQTGIISIENEKLEIENEAGAWFDLNGRKLNGKPTKRGVYINNGRKAVIK